MTNDRGTGALSGRSNRRGVLLRAGEPGTTTDRITVAYDALAGHLIANVVLARRGREGLEEWLNEPATMTALGGPLHDQHPLAADTLWALVGLLPRRLHRQQLWPLLPQPMRTAALLRAADLEAAYLDAATVRELTGLIEDVSSAPRDLFDRLRQTRASPAHPLNWEFLDATLRPMSVAQRDLRWTEWVRQGSGELIADLQRLEQRWHSLAERSPADQLRARWVMWMLTSTARTIRDQATCTLYWFGRGEPAALFNLTLNSRGINDPSVPERMLAASYGVVMAYQLPDPDLEKALYQFLLGPTRRPHRR